MHAMQSGIVPPLVPFAQTFAAVITAALTGSLYYIATAPKGDPCSTNSPNLYMQPVMQIISVVSFHTNNTTQIGF